MNKKFKKVIAIVLCSVMLLSPVTAFAADGSGSSFKASRGTYDPVTGIWTIGDLANQSTVILTIVAEALKEGVVVNEAYVESDTYDPNMTNNYDNATVTVEESENPPGPPRLHETGNPIVLAILALLAVVGVNIRRKL